MFAKINITGTITSKTGMHIGGASGFSAIGAIDSSRVRRLFGYMEDGKGRDKKAHTARLQFSDMFLKNSDELKRIGVPVTEVKFENTINRLTAVANPRQIERSVAGAQYGLDLIYSVEKEEEMVEDFETIRDGLILLSYDGRRL